MSALILAFLALSTPVQSPTCTPEWLSTFGGEPGFDLEAYAAVTFDDGSGPKLYVGGNFTSAGGVPVNRIARWDGATWSAVGPGLNSRVNALAVFDDGTGEALYAGGAFFPTLEQPLSRIARWDGTTWSSLGAGVGNEVHALTVWNDGMGTALYASGDFTSAGGLSANRIAKWNGQTWSPLGSGLNARTEALVVHDDGTGAALYAGGSFTTAGGQPAQRLARWNGSLWRPVGGGADFVIHALASFPSGSTQALYVGGEFLNVGGQPVPYLAAWNGSTFSGVGAGVNGSVRALRAFDDGSGNALYVGGSFGAAGGIGGSGAVARWNGTNWSTTPGAPSGNVRALAAFPEGPGSALHVVGGFVSAGGQAALRIARLDGNGWGPLGAGGLNGAVRAIRSFDDGTGPAVYVGGDFTSIGGQPIQYLARWNGSQWSAVGAALDGAVDVLEVLDSGTGPALHVGGTFAQVGSLSVRGLARWDGAAWSAFGSGFTTGFPPFQGVGGVRSLATFDDGSGSALYASGSFISAGGAPISYLARWDGSSWGAVGGGVPQNLLGVFALEVADLGSGPVLVAGGFSTTLAGTKSVASWNGTGWSQVGLGLGTQLPGLGTTVEALEVFDDGSGPALYAAGSFDASGQQQVQNVARWNGTLWEAVGGGTNAGVRALRVVNDGFGSALIAGGDFTAAGGAPAARLARWNGAIWSPIASALNKTVLAIDAVQELGGPALLVGGSFTASPAGDAYLARWKPCGLGALSAIPGCLGNSAQLETLSPGLVQGQNADFRSSSDLGDGVALLFAGLPGTDVSGCGLFVQGLGEVLLSTGPGLLQLGAAPTTNGAASFQVPVPTNPALLGQQLGLQSAHILLSLPGAPVELSNGLFGYLLL